MAIVQWDVLDSNLVYNKYRALCGLWPLTTTWHGTPVKLLKVSKYQIDNLDTQLKPGEIVYDKQRHKLFVTCGGGKRGFICIEKIKIPGHRTMSGKDFYSGFVYKKPKNEWRFSSTE